MPPIHFGFRLLSGAAIAFAMLSGCDLSSTSAAGGTDDTHTGIVNIQGRVLTSDTSPFGNVVVRLRGLNLLDTTDSDGRFQFLSDAALVSPASGSAVDTVDYLRDGQAIVSMPVPAWTTTLPDIMLVQRDFSGTVVGGASRISGASCKLRLPNGTVQRIDLEWNAVQRTFGGFAYFRYQGGVDSFAAVAEVRDDSDRILGRSDSVLFTSRAGDIVFPSFATDNALPKVAFHPSDSLVAGRGQSVHLFAETYSHPEGFLALEWNLDGVHWLRSSQRPAVKFDPADRPLSKGPIYDTTVTVPDSLAAGSIWILRARALTTNGTWTEDTLRIRIARTPPYARVRFASETSWAPAEMDIAPGSRHDVQLTDSGVLGARIVSRRLHLVQLKYRDTAVNCVEVFQPITDPPTYSTTRCVAPAPIAIVALGGNGSGVRVSGSDTTISFPSVPGEYQLRYEVIDSDGDTSLAISRPVVVRPAAPRIDSIVVSADSIQIDWSAPRPTVRPQAEPSTTRWILKARWIASDRIDSATIELPDASRSVVLHPPSDMVSMGFGLMRSSAEIDGFPADTATTSPSPLRLTFSGSILDRDRLHGRVLSRGGARALLTGSVGANLRGEVAHASWFMEDSTGQDAVATIFALPAPQGAHQLEMDLDVPAASPSRIVLLTSEDKHGTQVLGQKSSFGWGVPAGFTGHLVLSLDSARWQNLTPPIDTTDLARAATLADIQGIAVVIESRSDAPLVAGHMELDNIAWK